jgi:alkanesulfonate monooxygenase SsuD/methylene tetrahydromethanopterin reductase-like flavin-dependent oxidoreductase (luciferase family)
MPQPLTFAAAVAARTSRVRIGTAVLLAALRHPVHIAEEAALVDVLSEGRLELGFGAGYSPREFTAFGADLRGRFASTDAAVREVRRLVDEGVVTPAPVQRPLPIWLGYQGPKGARRAGRLGAGLLAFSPAVVQPYLQGLAEGGHDPVCARLGGLIDLLVTDDPESALEQVLPHYAYQQNTYRRARATGTDAARWVDDPPEAVRARVLARHRGALAVVTPDEAALIIRQRTDGLPVEHVYCWASVAGMPDELVDRHLELLLTRVRPALAADNKTPTQGGTHA